MKAGLRFKGNSYRSEIDEEFAAVLMKLEAPDAYPISAIESQLRQGSLAPPVPIPAFLFTGVCAQARLFGATDWVQSFLELLTRGDCKRILRKLWRVSIKVGGRLVRIGRIIVKTFLTLVEEFPATTAFIVLMALLSFMLSTIPVIGPVLAHILKIPALVLAAVLLLFEGWMKLKTLGKFDSKVLAALK